MGKNLNGMPELVSKVSELGKVTKGQAKGIIDLYISSVLELIKDESHDGLAIQGFETYEIKTKEAREYRNPQTGASVPKGAEEYVSNKLSKKIRKLDF